MLLFAASTAWPCPALLLLLQLLLLLSPPAQSCQDTAWSHGYLGPGDTIITPVDSTCSCCAYCHTTAGCASLSFHQESGECRLHNSVASYASLTPDPEHKWRYFVLPGRSERGQFCRRDSDCVNGGDRCRGRVCTDLAAVTCHVIRETFGAGSRYGTEVGMLGWVAGDRQLHCKMNVTLVVNLVTNPPIELQGYTLLFRSENGFMFPDITEESPLEAPATGPYSILGLAEDIRLNNPTGAYHVVLHLVTKPDVWIHFDMPGTEPVVADTARLAATSYTTGWVVENQVITMLYRPGSGPTLLSVNALDPDNTKGAIASFDGTQLWGNGPWEILFHE